MRSNVSSYSDRHRRGSVLVILMAISAVVAALGGSMLTMGYHSQVRATQTTQKMAARVAADAGLTRGIYTLEAQFAAGTLSVKSLPTETNVDLPNSDAAYSYAVTVDEAGGYKVTATGTYGAAQVTVEGTMSGAGLTHEYAIFTEQDLVLRNSSVVDWYNHKSGDEPLKVGTNSTDSNKITLYHGSHVNGDLVVGAGGDPFDVILDKGGTYTGLVYAQSTSHPVPAVVVPDYLRASASKGDITTNTTISSSGRYDGINLGNSKRLVIDGNVELYIDGPVILKKSAVVEINEGGSLVLYVAGDIEGKNSSQFNNKTKDPRRLKVMGTDACTDVELKNSGNMYAIVYTPDADLTVHNSATIRGAVTSKTCELKNSGTLYYDASLDDYEDPLLAELKLTRWREY